nr:TITAN-like protein isoform X1 [Ipomoea batatas]
MDKIDCYRITEADFAKWEKQCKALKTEDAGGGSHGPLIGPSNVMRDLRYMIQSYQLHRVVVLIYITVMQAYHAILLLMDL